MKKLLLVLLVAGGLGVGTYRLTTGRLPWEAMSAEEQQVAELREAFSRVRQQWKQAGRAATTGVDTGSITDTPLAELEHLEEALTELTPRLRKAEAQMQAGQLHREIATFKNEMK